MLKGGIAATIVGALFVLAGFWAGFLLARQDDSRVQSAAEAAGPATPSPATRAGFASLNQTVTQLLGAAGVSGGVTLSELGGSEPQTWSLNGDQQFTAASTYKLPLLMEEAENVAGGRWHGTDKLCYQDSDWEDGYYSDYQDGTCMSRSQLEHRVGLNSDNTAAHMLVRYGGGAAALNRYAQAHGAKESAFFVPNTTTSADLARLWVDEATEHAGGRPAQQYLYPMLTHTSEEDGIPAGVPSGTAVVHKIGDVDDVVNDAALVPKGPHGAYVLTICTEGQAGDWKLLADISHAVWAFEAAR